MARQIGNGTGRGSAASGVPITCLVSACRFCIGSDSTTCERRVSEIKAFSIVGERVGFEVAKESGEKRVDRESLDFVRWVPAFPLMARVFSHRNREILRNPAKKDHKCFLDAVGAESRFDRVVFLFVTEIWIDFDFVARNARFFPHFAHGRFKF